MNGNKQYWYGAENMFLNNLSGDTVYTTSGSARYTVKRPQGKRPPAGTGKACETPYQERVRTWPALSESDRNSSAAGIANAVAYIDRRLQTGEPLKTSDLVRMLGPAVLDREDSVGWSLWYCAQMIQASVNKDYVSKVQLMEKVVGALQTQRAMTWGWGIDPLSIGYEHILYLELPTGKQVSAHSVYGGSQRYDGDWDGYRAVDKGLGRILPACTAHMQLPSSRDQWARFAQEHGNGA